MESQSASGRAIEYHYIFKFNDGAVKSFQIDLDDRTLNMIQKAKEPLPEWARLQYSRCRQCPLDADISQYCPIAVNMAHLVGEFKDFASYENAYVRVLTKDRDIGKSTTVQEGLSSIMGVYMVTSGCPVMGKLKPMVRYHLPFSTISESVYRVVSMYLFAQYFLKKKGKKPDWDLKQLDEIYEDIRAVNAGISARLKTASIKDANVTAVAGLDYLASLLPLIINDTLQQIEDSFDSYLSLRI